MKNLICIIALFFITGCNIITEGTVISKRYVPAHVEARLTYNDTFQTIVVEDVNVPDFWYLTIQKDGKTREIVINQKEYNQYLADDWYPKNGKK